MSLKSIAEQAAHSLGAVNLIRGRNAQQVRILMYHRFHEGATGLRAQCEHIVRHYHPISLDELAQAVHTGQPLPPNSLAITVDDGFQDFAEAFPVFQEFGLKVTLYVVSGFAAGELWLWPDQLLLMCENTPLRQAEIAVPGGGSARVDFTNPAAAFDSLCQTLIGLRNQDRLDILRRLPALLRTELPGAVPARFAPLSWEELRGLAAKGLDIGAHTATHPILSRLEPMELAAEIAGSKVRIEEGAGVKVRHFCYPNGKFPDVSPRAISTAEHSGFETAVLAESGFAGPPFHLFQLKRLAVDPGMPSPYFQRYIAGYRV